MESKDEIRKRVLKLRNEMSFEDIRRKSTAIFEKVLTLRQYEEAKVILVYMDFKNEVMTGEFINRCICDGKKVALPKVADAGGEREPKVSSVEISTVPVSTNVYSAGEQVAPDHNLAVYIVNDMTKDMCPGYKGIIEPDGSRLRCLNPEEIDLAVIPGVAFDYGKNRIGYGAGYYDRFLRKLRSDCLKVGVAFRLQLVDKIPAGRYDIAVNMIITENKILV